MKINLDESYEITKRSDTVINHIISMRAGGALNHGREMLMLCKFSFYTMGNSECSMSGSLNLNNVHYLLILIVCFKFV